MIRLAVAVAILCAWTAARAEGTDVNDAARALFAKGVEAYGQGRYAEARDAFESSYARRPVPEVLFNLAMAEYGLKRAAATLNALARFASATHPDALPAERRQIIDQVTREVAPRAARLEFLRPAKPGTRLDGAGIEGEVVWVEPGAHTLAMIDAGRVVWTRAVTVVAGARMMIELGGDETPPIAAASPRPRFSQTALGKATITLAVIGGVALVSAAATGGVSLAERDRYESSCTNGACDDAIFVRGRALAHATDALVAIGGASAVTAVILGIIHVRSRRGAR